LFASDSLKYLGFTGFSALCLPTLLFHEAQANAARDGGIRGGCQLRRKLQVLLLTPAKGMKTRCEAAN
jgi:hypothetical protein